MSTTTTTLEGIVAEHLVAADLHHPPLPHRYIGGPRGTPCPVDHRAGADDKIKHLPYPAPPEASPVVHQSGRPVPNQSE